MQFLKEKADRFAFLKDLIPHSLDKTPNNILGKSESDQFFEWQISQFNFINIYSDQKAQINISNEDQTFYDCNDTMSNQFSINQKQQQQQQQQQQIKIESKLSSNANLNQVSSGLLLVSTNKQSASKLQTSPNQNQLVNQLSQHKLQQQSLKQISRENNQIVDVAKLNQDLDASIQFLDAIDSFEDLRIKDPLQNFQTPKLSASRSLQQQDKSNSNQRKKQSVNNYLLNSVSNPKIDHNINNNQNSTSSNNIINNTKLKTSSFPMYDISSDLPQPSMEFFQDDSDSQSNYSQNDNNSNMKRIIEHFEENVRRLDIIKQNSLRNIKITDFNTNNNTQFQIQGNLPAKLSLNVQQSTTPLIQNSALKQQIMRQDSNLSEQKLQNQHNLVNRHQSQQLIFDFQNQNGLIIGADSNEGSPPEVRTMKNKITISQFDVDQINQNQFFVIKKNSKDSNNMTSQTNQTSNQSILQGNISVLAQQDMSTAKYSQKNMSSLSQNNNENNFDHNSVSKLSSSNQSAQSSSTGYKQNVLQNFGKNMAEKHPGYFQDFSTDQDLMLLDLPQQKSELVNNLQGLSSMFKSQSFLSQKNNSPSGGKTQDKSKKLKDTYDQPSPYKTPQSQSSSQAGTKDLIKEKTKLLNKTYTELNNLLPAQEIKCGNDAVWCIKFRSDGLYMATGGKDGVLRVWKVCESSSEMNQRQTINPVPYREFPGSHNTDIFDVNWSTKNLNLILTASADFNVLIFNINIDKPLKILQHPDVVSSAIFKINSENYLASGCFDKFVRIWCINTKKVIDWQQTSCYITAIKYTNCGERLYVGLVNGDVVIYDSTQEKLKPLRVVICKNKRGKFSKGRKVTSIDFLSVNLAMITNNDSRIRFIDARNGKQIYKIKGHKNESFPIKASISDDYSHVICGSEDGDLYLWSQIQSTVNQMSKKTLIGKLLLSDKSNSCEYFTPYGKNQSVTSAVFAPQQVIQAQMRRYFKVMSDKIINMIFVMGNINGVIKIYHNETSCQSPNNSPRQAKNKFKRLSGNL